MTTTETILAMITDTLTAANLDSGPMFLTDGRVVSYGPSACGAMWAVRIERDGASRVEEWPTLESAQGRVSAITSGRLAYCVIGD